MVDVAKLDIVVDTSQIRSAADDLSIWSVEAARAEKTTGAAARAFDDMNGKVRVAGGVIAKTNSEVVKLGAANGKTTASLTSTFAVAQLVNNGPPVAQATTSSASGGTLDLSRPTGYSSFDFIRDHASQAGEPLRKSEAQEAGEALQWFLQLVDPVIRDAKTKLVVNQGNNILGKLLQQTDMNKQAEAFEKIEKDYEEKQKRSDRRGNSMPQFKTDAEDAKQMLDAANSIYKSRISINDTYGEAEKNLSNFMKENYSIVDDARIQRNTPGASYYEFAAPLEKLINGLQHMDAVPEDVNKVSEGIAKVIAKPENADIVSELKELQASWQNKYAGLILPRLEKVQETSTEAKVAVANYMTNGGAAGTSGSAQNINKDVGDSNSTAQTIALKSSEWANTSSKFVVDGIAAATRLLISSIAGFSSSTAEANSVAKIVSPSTAKVDIGGAADRADGDIAVEKSAKATDTTTKSSAAYAEQTRRTTQASAQSAAATDNLNAKVVTLKQGSDDLQKSGAARLAQMPQLTKAANDQAAAYEKIVEAQKKLTADIQFQQDQMGRSTIEQAIATTQKQYGLPIDMNSTSADMIRNNEQLKYARDLAGDFTKTLVTGLRNGDGLWKSFGNAAISVLTKISDTLLNDVLNSLFKVNSAASGSGLFGGLGSLFGLGGGGGFNIGSNATAPTSGFDPFSVLSAGWADGGYTGPGGVNDPAGVVHAGEIVWSQKDIARAGGIGVVEAMRAGRRGYADGGLVAESGPQFSRAQPNAPVPNHRIKAVNQNSASGANSGVHVTVGVSVDENGNLKAYVKNVAQSEAKSSTRQGLNDFNQQLPDRVAQINRNPRRR